MSRFPVRELGENITVLGNSYGEDAQFTSYYCGIICYVPGFTLQGEEEPFSGKGLLIQVMRPL